jgi:hypothetical protein
VCPSLIVDPTRRRIQKLGEISFQKHYATLNQSFKVDEKTLSLKLQQKNFDKKKINKSLRIFYTTFSTIKQEIFYTVKKLLAIVNIIPYENFLYDIILN